MINQNQSDIHSPRRNFETCSLKIELELDVERMVFVRLESIESAEPVTTIERLERFNIFVGQPKVENVEVGFDARRRRGLGNYNNAAVDLETHKDRCGSLAVLGGDLLDFGMFEKRRVVSSGPDRIEKTPQLYCVNSVLPNEGETKPKKHQRK